MTPSDLQALLLAPEDGMLERKPDGAKRDEIRRTLVAFANSVPEGKKAVLVVGVHDAGAILGVQNPESEQKRIRDIAERDCYPAIAVEAEVASFDGKQVVAVFVPHSRRRPHFAGPAFVRRGSESVAASEQQYEDLINSRTEKARVILQWKGGTPITVRTVRHVLGKTKVVHDSNYQTECDCYVLGCDSHTLTLEIIPEGRTASEPLELVSISRDDARRRPMLIVRGAQ